VRNCKIVTVTVWPLAGLAWDDLWLPTQRAPGKSQREANNEDHHGVRAG